MSAASLKNVFVVLVEPTQAGNVGLAARAVKAFGLGGLRIAGPMPGKPGEAAYRAAHATDVVGAAVVAPDLAQALPAGAWAVGTAAARGDLAGDVEVRTPRDAAPELLRIAATRPVALVFGTEANGLDTATLKAMPCVLSIPTDAAYGSLNLAQAVTVCAYELASLVADPGPPLERAAPADMARLEERMLALLLRMRFTDPRQQFRAAYPVRRMLARAGATPRDVRLLMGIVVHLERAFSAPAAGPEKA